MLPRWCSGQPGPQYSNPLGIGPMGLNSPLALAVDPTTGNLYVADYGNNRVLRFPSPFENRSRVQPDAVYGQPNFTTTGPGVSKALLYRPRAVAFDSGAICGWRTAGTIACCDSARRRSTTRRPKRTP